MIRKSRSFFVVDEQGLELIFPDTEEERTFRYMNNQLQQAAPIRRHRTKIPLPDILQFIRDYRANKIKMADFCSVRDVSPSTATYWLKKYGALVDQEQQSLAASPAIVGAIEARSGGSPQPADIAALQREIEHLKRFNESLLANNKILMQQLEERSKKS